MNNRLAWRRIETVEEEEGDEGWSGVHGSVPQYAKDEVKGRPQDRQPTCCQRLSVEAGVGTLSIDRVVRSFWPT